MGSSSSAYYVVREIIDSHLPVTLLTNSVQVMALAAGSSAERIELIGLGGTFRRLTESFVGARTVSAIETFFADRIIFSVKGIEPEGFLTDPDLLEAEVKRAMVRRARTVVLVAAPQKFSSRGLNVIVPASTVDVAYLADPPAPGVRRLVESGVPVTTV